MVCRPPSSPSGCSDSRRDENANMAKAELRDLPTLQPDLLYSALGLMILMCIAVCSYFHWYVKCELRNKPPPQKILRSTPEDRANELVYGLIMRQTRPASEGQPIACNGQALRSDDSPAQASRSMPAGAPRPVRQQTSQAGPAQMNRRRQSGNEEHANAMRTRVRASG